MSVATASSSYEIFMSSSCSRMEAPRDLKLCKFETLQVMLTMLSLPSTSSTATQTPTCHSSPPPPASQQELSSPASFDSRAEFPLAKVFDVESPTNSYGDQARPGRRKRNRGSRQRLSNLPTPPSPFGSHLGMPPPTPRSTSYNHVPRHRSRFTPRPTRRELAVENGEVPRSDPEQVYDTFLSAVDSFKKLAVRCGEIAAEIITQRGKKDWTVQVTKTALVLVCVFRPRWVLGAMNASYSVLRDPWRSYHHALYTVFIARFLIP